MLHRARLAPPATSEWDTEHAGPRRAITYKCPRGVEFRPALPMTGAGKIQKTVLRKPFWEGRSRAVN